MDCGGAPLCGVLTLETGYGHGYYAHASPSVHGLWPAVGNYGNSKCVRPTVSAAAPTKVYPCYAADANQLWFEQHEWKNHGVCAGARDADDFFGQVCALSSGPLQVLESLKSSGLKEIGEFGTRLAAAGYPVHSTDAYTSQVQLSACAGSDGQWVMSPVDDFGARCGNGGGGGSGLGRPATSFPSAEPMKAPDSDNLSPMEHMFMELWQVRIGDKVCFEGLVSKLSKSECPSIASVLTDVTCAKDYVQSGFVAIVEDVRRYTGGAYFTKLMQNHWFPDPVAQGVGSSGSSLSWQW